MANLNHCERRLAETITYALETDDIYVLTEQKKREIINFLCCTETEIMFGQQDVGKILEYVEKYIAL